MLFSNVQFAYLTLGLYLFPRIACMYFIKLLCILVLDTVFPPNYYFASVNLTSHYNPWVVSSRNLCFKFIVDKNNETALVKLINVSLLSDFTVKFSSASAVMVIVFFIVSCWAPAGGVVACLRRYNDTSRHQPQATQLLHYHYTCQSPVTASLLSSLFNHAHFHPVTFLLEQFLLESPTVNRPLSRSYSSRPIGRRSRALSSIITYSVAFFQVSYFRSK